MSDPVRPLELRCSGWWSLTVGCAARTTSMRRSCWPACARDVRGGRRGRLARASVTTRPDRAGGDRRTLGPPHGFIGRRYAVMNHALCRRCGRHVGPPDRGLAGLTDSQSAGVREPLVCEPGPQGMRKRGEIEGLSRRDTEPVLWNLMRAPPARRRRRLTRTRERWTRSPTSFPTGPRWKGRGVIGSAALERSAPGMSSASRARCWRADLRQRPPATS